MDRPSLDVDRLRRSLAARWPRLEVVESTGSTNADLAARTSAPDRSVLVAEHQDSGRGRFDRVWTSPPRSGLTFSVLLRPSAALPTWGWLPLLAGVAVVEAVRDVAGAPARLKWPNDVLVDGAKLAGILAQIAGDAVVVGVGCNVTEAPVEGAASLGDVDRTGLLVALLSRLDARAAQWDDCSGDAAACGLAAAYRGFCDTLGAKVRVRTADGSAIEGEARDVDENGHLVLDVAGTSRVIGAGDVEHLRPAR